MIVRDMLRRARKDRAAERIVAITDPARGTMRRICDAEGYQTLPVPEGVGGRFSALSCVGLFSSAMVGIDCAALLDGAAEMDDRCASPQLAENPAALLATILVSLGAEKGKSCHVMMPYSSALSSLADWFAQLWAESLGKMAPTIVGPVGQGFTPIKALGATDQHSQIQLYREGPNDKVIGFVEVEDFGADVPIPAGLGVESLAYLEGSTLGTLLRAEKRATEYALVDSGRPNFTIRMGRVDEAHVGGFMWLWQMATAYAGVLLGVNAYDQPAVETGKQATFGLMGRAGYERWREAVGRTLG
jgi:glucose-6-phosphate isomerase